MIANSSENAAPKTRKKLTLASTAVALVAVAYAALFPAVDSKVPEAATAVTLSPPQGVPRATAQLRDAYGKLPLHFEANHGQAGESVDFLARGAGYLLALSATDAVFVLRNAEREATSGGAAEGLRPVSNSLSEAPPPAEITGPQSRTLRMSLVGADPSAAGAGLDQLGGKVNYFRGSDPAQWRTNVQTFGRVRYAEVYAGIDVVYYGNQQRLEYDFVVAPGADPGAIALEFTGAEKVEVEAATGDLLVHAGEEPMRQYAPVTYQEMAGVRRAVESRYALRDGGRVVIEVGEYDTSAPLVIDPVIQYSTYLGGASFETGQDIAVDSEGNAYVTGSTSSSNFLTVSPIDGTYNGGGSIGFGDVFVTKINAAGTGVIYSTFLGGEKGDAAYAVAVDSAGNAYVTGETASTNFPTASPIKGSKSTGVPSGDVFVTKINAAGTELVYSTYIGSGEGRQIAVDSGGNAYVAARTIDKNFPTANPIDGTYNGNSDGIVLKINAAGTALVYSTYLGGADSDLANGIAVDSAGSAYVTGFAKSSNFPTASPIDGTFNGGVDDAFVAKLSAAGTALVYSTFLGGDDSDSGQDIAVDSAGNAYVTGGTSSSNFPIVSKIDTGDVGGSAFVTKINAAGTALIYSTFLDSDHYLGNGIAIDPAGNAYVTGGTESSNCSSATTGAFDTTYNGGTDAFITKISETASPAVLVGCPSQLLNISTRLRVGTGENALIGGFIITGGVPKKVIIRAIGPSLAQQGVSGVLANPTLELFDGAGNPIASNDDWKQTQQAEIEASTIPPQEDAEAAIVRVLAPGSYTAVVRGKEDSTGVGLVEVYDLGQAANARLANISSRGFVEAGENVMIGGFIVGPAGNADARVVVRAIGPSLTAQGVAGALQDPSLELVDAQGTALRMNDNWKSDQQAELEAISIQPSDDRESALIERLVPGNYTAIVRGALERIGVGLVEVYNLQ